VEEAIKVYKHLHVQLLFCSYPVKSHFPDVFFMLEVQS